MTQLRHPLIGALLYLSAQVESRTDNESRELALRIAAMFDRPDLIDEIKDAGEDVNALPTAIAQALAQTYGIEAYRLQRISCFPIDHPFATLEDEKLGELRRQRARLTNWLHRTMPR